MAQVATGEPLYVNAAERIRQRVRELDLRPGDLIEPERVLLEELGVSRVTIRKAVDLLVEEHLLVRRQGIGTFVASPKITYPLAGLHSTREVLQAHGINLDVRIVEYAVGRPSATARQRLELARGERVVRFVRCDSSGGQAICAAEVVVPERLAAALSEEALLTSSSY